MFNLFLLGYLARFRIPTLGVDILSAMLIEGASCPSIAALHP
jgi:hypothetical protein